MLRKLIPVDSVLKKLPHYPFSFTRFLLKLNKFPRLLYGSSYYAKKEQIGEDFDHEQALISVVNHAIENVPYYKKRYNSISNFRDFENDLRFIDKAEVLKNFNDFIALDTEMKNFVSGTTGGTSGKPMQLIIPKDRYNFELPTVHSYWNEYGWNFHLRGVIRNHKLPKDKDFLLNPLTKELFFDAFRINKDYVEQIYRILRKNDVQYLQAYPSAAFLFCSICKEEGFDISFLKAIFTSSEAVLDFQKKMIVDELGIPLFNLYGHSEKLIIAGYCEKTDNMHFESSYGYAELINEKNEPINTPGEVGELVGTTFHNFGMPLIRFKTGDWAEYVGHYCEACGKKSLTVRNIEGHHTRNIIYKNDNTYTSSTALNLHGEIFKKIEGMQYIQKRKGQLEVRIIKNEFFQEEDHAEFVHHYENAMGENAEVKVTYVTKLERLPNGKFPLLISKIAK